MYTVTFTEHVVNGTGLHACTVQTCNCISSMYNVFTYQWLAFLPYFRSPLVRLAERHYINLLLSLAQQLLLIITKLRPPAATGVTRLELPLLNSILQVQLLLPVKVSSINNPAFHQPVTDMDTGEPVFLPTS